MSRCVLLSLALVGFSVLSLLLRENYPFSHFPMYGNPSDDVYYLWLADAEKRPLPVQALTGKTAPKLGKMLRTYADLKAKELKLKRSALPESAMQQVFTQLLAYLRQEAKTLKQTLPERLTLMRTDVKYAQGRLIETPSTLFAE
jgi:gas vesicle protein